MVEGIATQKDTRAAGETVAEGRLVGAARAVENVAHHVKETVKEKVHHATDALKEKTVSNLLDDGRHFVRENPGTTILVSVGVGAIVGYLLGRRRS